MNRKRFLISSLSLLGSSGIGALPVPIEDRNKKKPLYRRPPYLSKGDTIGITCPAGYISSEDAAPAISQLKAWGYEVESGRTIGKRDFTFGGTDDERRADLQEMLDNRKIKAILCARGGYGVVRIIDKLRFEKFQQHPKWIIGFSDITTLHCHIHHHCGIATLHAKMCNSFPADISQASPEQLAGINSIRQCLTGEAITYEAPAHPANRKGKAEGELIGGNLSIIENLSGSRSDINTDGKILFLEDTGEYLYHIDRMFWNLKRSGKLNKLAGLIIGGFNIKKEEDPDDTFGIDLTGIVNEKVKGYRYPVCFGFPVGHQKNNQALPCGMAHRLIVSEEGTRLQKK
jgi:muramoyltetrapeptide carboxypeptidase